MTILNHTQMNNSSTNYITENGIESPATYSVQTESNTWADDDFCGTLEECLAYIKKGWAPEEYTDPAVLKIALISLTKNFLSDYCHEIIEGNALGACVVD